VSVLGRARSVLRKSGRITPVGRDNAWRRRRWSKKTVENLERNAGRDHRRLDIGPGTERIEGFEGIGAVSGAAVDYVLDASRGLPFDDGTFEVVHAAHILEHIAWYQSEKVLADWARVVAPGGWLEVWVPDGLKIARAWVEAEDGGRSPFEVDNWTRLNPEQDVALWASGRIFTYGDGTGRIDDFNWHRAVYSERRLRLIFERAGLEEVERMDPSEVRGYDHGWINLGVKGRKPA
jgi:SAM-dependent methyltransferase